MNPPDAHPHTRDPGTENNPYLGFVFTSFQERATKVAHGNTARLAKQAGDETLAKARALRTLRAGMRSHRLLTRLATTAVWLDCRR